MKLLKLRFRNINSLAGDWEIDFTSPEFKEGLFSLTGTTGAGKTSVLDAICLGFYGQTARQKNITKTENEVMTRGTGDCFAEVEFEVNNAQYRSTWEQHRERKKAGGTLQAATRNIASLPDGVIIAEKITDANMKILDLTGMDFEQFTRSVLLAQGQFDAFLKADDKARSDILEQVTGTEIYSKIGSVVFARFQKERDFKDKLNEQLSFITFMSIDERTVLEKNIEDTKEKEVAADKIVKELNQQLLWLNGLKNLQTEMDGLELQQKKLHERRDAAKTDFDRLALAESAHKLDVVLLEMKTARTATEDSNKILKDRENNYKTLSKNYAELSPKVKTATDTAQKTEKTLNEQLPFLEEIKGIDRTIGIANTKMDSFLKAEREANQMFEYVKKEHSIAVKKLRIAESALTEANVYLECHAVDDRLGDILPSVETTIKFWEQLKTDAVKKKIAADKALADATDKRQKATVAQKSFLKLQVNFNNKKKVNDKAKEVKNTAEIEFNNRQPDLKIAINLAFQNLQLTQQIATLDQQRKLLEDGKACPLCGSVEHPFALGNIPEVSVAQKEFDMLNEKLKSLRKDEEDARKAFDRANKAFQKVSNEFQQSEVKKTTAMGEADAAENTAKSAREIADSSQHDADNAWQGIVNSLAQVDSVNITPEIIAEEIKELKKRLSEFEVQTNAAQTTKSTIDAGKDTVTKAEEQLKKANESLIEKTKEVKSQKKEVDLLNKSRNDKFKGDTEKEENRLRSEYDNARTLHEKLRAELKTLKKQLETATEEINKSAEIVRKKSEEESRILQSALQKLADAGFADESACRLARMDDNEYSRLKQLKDEIKKSDIEIGALNNKISAELKAEKVKALTDKSILEINTALLLQKEIIDESNRITAESNTKLKQDNEIQIKYQNQKEEFEKQHKVFTKWDTLNKWIGGNNGEKFKQYAQGLTLARLLSEANRHLIKMSAGRYEMFWKAQSTSLLPSVIDRHQGDVERPVSNFSGGETFMVSLSLALGLANMASGKLHIDSLFLDEGFGTLDSQTLDIAINTLAELHQTQGKLIGVISHIEQMKNQISTRIEIKKIGGGRSEMIGPGVRRISGITVVAETSKTKRLKKIKL